MNIISPIVGNYQGNEYPGNQDMHILLQRIQMNPSSSLEEQEIK